MQQVEFNKKYPLEIFLLAYWNLDDEHLNRGFVLILIFKGIGAHGAVIHHDFQ